jgi:hypothetical protein
MLNFSTSISVSFFWFFNSNKRQNVHNKEYTLWPCDPPNPYHTYYLRKSAIRKPAKNNSITLNLNLHSSHNLLNAINCRLNRHRDDVCFFNIHSTNPSTREMAELIRKSPELAVNRHDPWRKVYNYCGRNFLKSCLGFVLFVYGHFIFQFK